MARKKAKIKTSDVALVLVFAVLVVFTAYMCVLYRECGSIPDTLVTCVFATLGGECGALAWIRTTKEKYKDREWQKEDEKEARRDMNE
jgi:hypothetical protein